MKQWQLYVALLPLSTISIALTSASNHCTKEASYITAAAAIEDASWKEYLTYIYGEMPSSLSKHEVDLLYKLTPMAVTPFDWKHKRPLSALGQQWGDTYFHHSDRLHNDNEWVEVQRYSTHFLNSYKERDAEWNEGLSTGFPGRSKSNQTKVAYGCWFNLALGSGIYVNVGKTLQVNEKYHSTLFRDLGLTSKGCLPTEQSKHTCYDRYICTAALAKGYDSVQIASNSELVICSGKCATEPLRYACPPVELRSGYGATRPCNCSDGSHSLNCGNRPESIPNLKYSFPRSGAPDPAKQRTLCVARKPPPVAVDAFSITIAFTTGALAGMAPTAWLKGGRNTLSIEPNMLVDVGVVPPVEGKPVAFARAPVPGTNLGPTAQQQLQAQPARRQLQATPYGPYRHSSDPPPPPSLAEEFGQHHHSHHKKESKQKLLHKHIVENEKRVKAGNFVAADLWSNVRHAGYKIVVSNASYSEVNFERDEDAQEPVILQPSAYHTQRTMLVTEGTTRVGFVVYSPLDGTGSVRRVMDDAVCLREAGAVLVVMMTASVAPVQGVVLQELRGYVDLVISAGGGAGQAGVGGGGVSGGGSAEGGALSCDGRWHTASDGKVPHVHIDNSASIGLVAVRRDEQGRTAFQSSILTVQL